MDKTLQKIIKIIGILIICYLLYLIFPTIKGILYWFIKILMPFIIGFVGAYLLEPLVEKLSKYKINYKVSVIIIVLVFVVITSIFGVILFPKMVEQINLLGQNIPVYIQNISGYLDLLCSKLDFLPKEFLPSAENIQHYLIKLFTNATSNTSIILENITFYLVTIFISPILTIYFLLEFKKITSFIKQELLKREKEEVYQTLVEINKTMRSYFSGVIVVMIVLSLIATILFSVIGVELPLLWGIIIGITNIIPYIGPYIGGAVVVLFVLSTSASKVISVLIVIVALQIIESNFITPNIQSKKLKTSPILVLLFVSIFGEIMGVFGMIIAIPVLSIFQILLNKIGILEN